MGAIRDSFKKFLGFDVEERDTADQNSQNIEKQLTEETLLDGEKQYHYDDVLQDPNNDSLGKSNNAHNVRKRLNAEKEPKNLENDFRYKREHNNIFAKSKIKYEKPKTYGDACEIVEYLLGGYTVYVDVVDLEISKARRIVDFIDGGIFASGGDREIIKHKYFKFSPTYEEEEEKIS